MKKVFRKHEECINRFLEQSQSEGRVVNGRGVQQMIFEDANIWSYGTHYQLGKALQNNILFINCQDSTHTTNKQKRILYWKAKAAGWQAFYVQSFEDLQKNVEFYRHSIEENKKQLLHSRTHMRLNKVALERVIEIHNEYIKALGLSSTLATWENIMDDKLRIKLVVWKLRGQI